MMDARIEARTYGALLPTRQEILRYAGLGKEEDAQVEALLDKALSLSRGALCGRVCFSLLPLSHKDGELDLGFALTDSADLARALADSERILLFAATVGVEMDRLILRESRKSMTMGLLLGAIGTAAVEALCDRFCKELTEITCGAVTFSQDQEKFDIFLKSSKMSAIFCFLVNFVANVVAKFKFVAIEQPLFVI